MSNAIIKLHKYVFKIVFHTIKDFLAKMLLCKKSFYKNFKILYFIPINFYKLKIQLFRQKFKSPEFMGLNFSKDPMFYLSDQS